MTTVNIEQQSVILFDGICNLCNASVIFILKQERSPVFQFASIQSEVGKDLLEWCGLPRNYDQAIVLIDHGGVDKGSTAALKIGRQLRFPWSLFSRLGLLVPVSIRDWVYRQIATHRYEWFGKKDVCMVPTENLRNRFL